MTARERVKAIGTIMMILLCLPMAIVYDHVRSAAIRRQYVRRRKATQAPDAAAAEA